MATTQAMEEQQASNEAAYSAADNVEQAKSAYGNAKGAIAGLGSSGALGAGGLALTQTSASGATALAAAAGGAVIGLAAATAGAYLYGKYKTAKQKKKMYKAYYNAAQATLQEREMNAQYDNYLNMIRQARIARAGTATGITTAGLETSSLGTSALSSIGSQSQYSMQYTANDQRLIKQYEDYMTRAKSAAAKYQANMSVVTGVTQLGFMAAGAAVGGIAGGAKGAQLGMQVGGSVGNIATGFMQ